MNPDQINTITRSFGQIVPIEDTLAALFYGRLFTVAPSLRPMFGTDMRAQGRKFRDMLHVIVENLDDRDLLVRSLQECGQRHAGYGVHAEHYALVGTALLWALQQTLNERYTPEVAQAWAALYHLVANTMQEAIEPATN